MSVFLKYPHADGHNPYQNTAAERPFELPGFSTQSGAIMAAFSCTAKMALERCFSCLMFFRIGKTREGFAARQTVLDEAIWPLRIHRRPTNHPASSLRILPIYIPKPVWGGGAAPSGVFTLRAQRNSAGISRRCRSPATNSAASQQHCS